MPGEILASLLRRVLLLINYDVLSKHVYTYMGCMLRDTQVPRYARGSFGVSKKLSHRLAAGAGNHRLHCERGQTKYRIYMTTTSGETRLLLYAFNGGGIFTRYHASVIDKPSGPRRGQRNDASHSPKLRVARRICQPSHASELRRTIIHVFPPQSLPSPFCT